MMMFIYLIPYICFLGFSMDAEPLLGSIKQENQTLFGIVGGKATSIKKHPYQVSIYNKKMVNLCSGVIVDEFYVLTAASCVFQYLTRASTIIVRAGSNDLFKGGQLYKAEKIYIHGSYDVQSRHYDFAVIKIGASIKFNKETDKIEYSTEPIIEGENGVVSGWSIDRRNKDKRDMKELPVTALDFEECKEGFSDIVSDTMMCVDSSSKYKNGFCDYSAGDAIVAQRKVVGIFTSFSECTLTKHPAIFSDVAFAAPWMDDIIKHS